MRDDDDDYLDACEIGAAGCLAVAVIFGTGVIMGYVIGVVGLY